MAAVGSRNVNIIHAGADSVSTGIGVTDANTLRVVQTTDGPPVTLTATTGAGVTDADTLRVVQATDGPPMTLPRSYIDAFGRLRVSNIETIFDSKQVFNADPVSWNISTTGTGSSTYTNSEARTRLTVGAAAGTSIRQTYRRFAYQPGKSQLIFMTGVIRVAGTFDNTVTSRIGYFSTNNGVFFSYSGGILNVNIRKGAVDTTVAQADWNIDTMDGNGESGITLDPTMTQIFVMNFEWLGVGSAWFGFVVGGVLYWCHRNDNSNISPTVYMATPNLPLRYEITCSGVGSGSVDCICSSVNSEGGVNPTGALRSFGCIDLLNANTVGVEYVAVMFRYKNESAAQILITDMVIDTVGNTADKYLVVLRIIRDTTKITNFGTQTWTSIVDSPLEASRPTGNPGNAVVTADSLDGTSGYVLSVSYAIGNVTSSSTSVKNSLTMGWSLAGQSDILSISIVPIGASLDVYAALTWREIQ